MNRPHPAHQPRPGRRGCRFFQQLRITQQLNATAHEPRSTPTPINTDAHAMESGMEKRPPCQGGNPPTADMLTFVYFFIFSYSYDGSFWRIFAKPENCAHTIIILIFNNANDFGATF
jgi:hypothetical protein